MAVVARLREGDRVAVKPPVPSRPRAATAAARIGPTPIQVKILPPAMPPASSLERPRVPPGFLLDRIADTELQIVRLELRLTRYQAIGSRLARAQVDVAHAAGLADIAQRNLDFLERQRLQLLAAWRSSRQEAA